MTMPLTSAADAHAAIVTIPPGMSSGDIADMLEREGLIRDARHFRLVSRLYGFESQLQAGDYLLSSDMGLLTVMETLRRGRIHAERVTIQEGLHLRQIADVLAAKGLVDRERFLMLAGDESLVYGDQPPIEKPVPSLEGYLFPDTYLFSPSMTEEQIIRTMVNRFVEVVLPVVEGRRCAPGHEPARSGDAGVHRGEGGAAHSGSSPVIAVGVHQPSPHRYAAAGGSDH